MRQFLVEVQTRSVQFGYIRPSSVSANFWFKARTDRFIRLHPTVFGKRQSLLKFRRDRMKFGYIRQSSVRANFWFKSRTDQFIWLHPTKFGKRQSLIKFRREQFIWLHLTAFSKRQHLYGTEEVESYQTPEVGVIPKLRNKRPVES